MSLQRMLFGSLAGALRTALLAFLAYCALVALLRVSGKRTLSKMNVYDFVFVVALGSALANTILNAGVPLTDGVAAFAALIALQVALSRLCLLSDRTESLINGDPALVFHRGRFLRDAMKKERVTEEEIRAAIRADGHAALEKVHAVVLETDGTFSVVRAADSSDSSALDDVLGHVSPRKPHVEGTTRMRPPRPL